MIPNNPNPMYLPLRNENLRAQKNLYINIYSSSVHNCQKLEIIQMFCNGYIHTMECNSVIKKKKEHAVDTHNLHESQRLYGE